MKRRQWREWWRCVWHGYSGTFEEYLELTVVERYFCNDGLDRLIKQSNAPRPREER